MKQKAPQTRHSHVGIPDLQAGEHVNRLRLGATTTSCNFRAIRSRSPVAASRVRCSADSAR